MIEVKFDFDYDETLEFLNDLEYFRFEKIKLRTTMSSRFITGIRSLRNCAEELKNVAQYQNKNYIKMYHFSGEITFFDSQEDCAMAFKLRWL